MLVPRQLTVDRGSIAFYHSRPHSWRSSSFSTPRRAISSCYPDSKSLVLSSPPPSPPPPSTLRASRVTSRAHCPDLREDRNILQPHLLLLLSYLFSSTSSGNSRDDTDERKSVERRYQTKFRARTIFLSPDRFGISLIRS